MPERTCQRPGCGRPIPSRKRKDARWCSRSCESKARRAAKRKADFEAANPGAAELLGAEDRSLTELYNQARAAREFADPAASYAVPPSTEPDDDYGDYHDITAYETPDEFEDNAFFSDAMRVQEAIEQIRAQYEALARPLLAAQARNPGVRLPALVKLETECEREINAILRPHQRAQALEWAARRQPEVQVRAAERQMEQAALNAFGRDLPGGSRRYHVDEFHGRDTTDIAVW